MSVRSLVVGGALLLAFAVTGPSQASAQLCVDDNCEECGAGGYSHQGMGNEVGTEYSIECPSDITSWCIACHPDLVSEFAQADQALLETIKTGAPEELVALVRKLHDRLLLSTQHHLIVVQGNGCDAEAFSSVIFLPEKAEQHIAGLGLRSLEVYLEKEG